MKRSAILRACAVGSLIVAGTFMTSTRLAADGSLDTTCTLSTDTCLVIEIGEICTPDFGCTTFPDLTIIGTKADQ
jgi:hypothetical protein